MEFAFTFIQYIHEFVNLVVLVNLKILLHGFEKANSRVLSVNARPKKFVDKKITNVGGSKKKSLKMLSKRAKRVKIFTFSN